MPVAVQRAMRAKVWSTAFSIVLLGCTHRGAAPNLEAPPARPARTIADDMAKTRRTSPPAAPPFSPTPLRAMWAITPPRLEGTFHVAAAPGSIYIAICRELDVLVERLDPRGALVWSAQIPGMCARFADGSSRPIAAATADGIVVALPAMVDGLVGARVLRLDSAGDIAWERRIRGEVRNLDVAATRGRIAICFDHPTSTSFEGRPLPTSDGDGIALELDDHGARVGTYAAPATRCTYDEESHLWMSGSGSAERVTGPRRHIVLWQANDSYEATAFETGWVVQQRDNLVFVDHDGARPWRIDWPAENSGCLVQPTPIAATAQRLLASVFFFCRPRGATMHFGDVTIQSEPGDAIVERVLVIDMDTVTMRTRAQFELEHPPKQMNRSMHYVPSSHGVLAYGHFQGSLGLGTNITSGPPGYRCVTTLPRDAQTRGSYSTDAPFCNDGYRLRTDYPSWPVVALFPVP
ncbi:hypothetical protein [Pendulispora albinea]|uniref:Uncharacterized protein n=1 Tax=Pendulispora albinea TaxID=2741071 RepID=A0ABZ2M282_9BACT